MSVRKLAAELLGTALLVFFGVGVATLMFGFHLDGGSVAAGVVATALTFGLVLLALVYTIGPISGCHVNPAVTIGFVTSGRMRLSEALGYWIAQFVGGILGALGLWAVLSGSPHYSRTVTGLGTDGWGSHSIIGLNLGGAFAAEVILTFLFVLVVLSATSHLASAGFAGLAIGMGLRGRPSNRDSPHRDVGQSGPQPRPGPDRRWGSPRTGVAVHRRAAPRRDRGGARVDGADQRALPGTRGRAGRALRSPCTAA